jgi:hypothetical protein
MPKSSPAFSISVGKNAASATDGASAVLCRSCGDVMSLDRTIPKLGVCPELRVFVCPSCKEIEAEEL